MMILNRAKWILRDCREVAAEFLNPHKIAEEWMYYSYYARMPSYDDAGNMTPGKPARRWRFALLHLKATVLAFRCAFTDHSWVDCSSVGPDSGDMDMYCKRCGKSFHHQLY